MANPYAPLSLTPPGQVKQYKLNPQTGQMEEYFVPGGINLAAPSATPQAAGNAGLLQSILGPPAAGSNSDLGSSFQQQGQQGGNFFDPSPLVTAQQRAAGGALSRSEIDQQVAQFNSWDAPQSPWGYFNPSNEEQGIFNASVQSGLAQSPGAYATGPSRPQNGLAEMIQQLAGPASTQRDPYSNIIPSNGESYEAAEARVQRMRARASGQPVTHLPGYETPGRNAGEPLDQYYGRMQRMQGYARRDAGGGQDISAQAAGFAPLDLNSAILPQMDARFDQAPQVQPTNRLPNDFDSLGSEGNQSLLREMVRTGRTREDIEGARTTQKMLTDLMGGHVFGGNAVARTRADGSVYFADANTTDPLSDDFKKFVPKKGRRYSRPDAATMEQVHKRRAETKMRRQFMGQRGIQKGMARRGMVPLKQYLTMSSLRGNNNALKQLLGMGEQDISRQELSDKRTVAQAAIAQQWERLEITKMTSQLQNGGIPKRQAAETAAILHKLGIKEPTWVQAAQIVGLKTQLENKLIDGEEFNRQILALAGQGGATNLPGAGGGVTTSSARGRLNKMFSNKKELDVLNTIGITPDMSGQSLASELRKYGRSGNTYTPDEIKTLQKYIALRRIINPQWQPSGFGNVNSMPALVDILEDRNPLDRRTWTGPWTAFYDPVTSKYQPRMEKSLNELAERYRNTGQ